MIDVIATLRITRENCLAQIRSDGATWGQFFAAYGEVVWIDWIGSNKGWTDIVLWLGPIPHKIHFDELSQEDELYQDLVHVAGPRII